MSKNYTIFVNHPSQYLTDCEPHGDGLLAYQYIDHLARRGHQLYVAAPIVKLRGPLHPNVHLFLVKTITRPSWERPSWPHRIEYAFRVRHLFMQLQRQISFDVIHQLNPVTTGVNLFLPSNNIPFIVGPLPPAWPAQAPTLQNSVIASCRSIMKRLIRWEMFRRASCILIPVPGGRESVPNSRSISSRIKLLHYGVDTKQFEPEKTPSETVGSNAHILFLANLHKRKGIYTLLEAFETVVKCLPQARLTIAGDGPGRDKVKEMVSMMFASNRITIRGAIAHDEVASVLRLCTIYCLPSYGEPFGMTALEAMSCGKPVVVTAAGGLDYLVDEQGGIKVPVGDPERLAAALIRLLADPQLCKQMGDHNREVAVSEYDWNRVISNLEQIYEQVIQGQ